MPRFLSLLAVLMSLQRFISANSRGVAIATSAFLFQSKVNRRSIVSAEASNSGSNAAPLHPTFRQSFSSRRFLATSAAVEPDTEAKARDDKSNPLLKVDSLPSFQDIKTEHILPAVESHLDNLKKTFKAFEDVLKDPQQGEPWGTKRIEYDYSSVIEELEKLQAPLTTSWGVVGHLMGVKNSPELREAHDKIQPNVIQVNQAMGQSKALFAALSALKKRKSVWDKLDETQQRIVTSAIVQMEGAGVGLSGEEREKFNKLQLEAAELSTKFNNNILDSTKAFKLIIKDKDEVDGLPESAKAFAAKQAKEQGEADATPENGPWLITLDMPSYLPCMQHIKNRDVREKLYRAFVSRASQGESDNAPVMKRILQIKQDMAKLLGYQHHAERSLSKKMAKDVQSVITLLEMLREKSYSAAQAELASLREFALSKGFKEELALWDIPFWSERMRESLYEYQEEELREYFPLESVLDGMFALAERLFGVKITAADGKAQVWNEAVRFFDIHDSVTGNYISSFYLDPFSRPAEKRGGAWMDICLGRSKVLDRKPVAYLTCNGSPPVGEKPSLMTFREVETLFHEFGHGLQHMLTNIEHGDAAGINNVEWDAVELPSQFMENWCLDRRTLNGFAKHYQTGASLPEELFNKIKAAKNFQAGMIMMRQLFFGTMDIKLHSVYDPYGTSTPFDIQKEVAMDYTVIPPLPEDRFLCSFSHIFAGGYSAGYYSYKWAEVMSADAFSAFEEVGLENDEAVRATGHRFRETVLGMGGGSHPSKVFELFRGRQPSPEALLRHSGLTK